MTDEYCSASYSSDDMPCKDLSTDYLNGENSDKYSYADHGRKCIEPCSFQELSGLEVKKDP